MTQVIVKGVFLGANVKTSTFDGKSTTSLYIDVYQPEAEGTNKVVQIKTDDIDLLNVLKTDYDMGSVFEVKASVNAYQNKAYFKLVDLIA